MTAAALKMSNSFKVLKHTADYDQYNFSVTCQYSLNRDLFLHIFYEYPERKFYAFSNVASKEASEKFPCAAGFLMTDVEKHLLNWHQQ